MVKLYIHMDMYMALFFTLKAVFLLLNINLFNGRLIVTYHNSVTFRAPQNIVSCNEVLSPLSLLFYLVRRDIHIVNSPYKMYWPKKTKCSLTCFSQ